MLIKKVLKAAASPGQRDGDAVAEAVLLALQMQLDVDVEHNGKHYLIEYPDIIVKIMEDDTDSVLTSSSVQRKPVRIGNGE